MVWAVLNGDGSVENSAFGAEERVEHRSETGVHAAGEAAVAAVQA